METIQGEEAQAKAYDRCFRKVKEGRLAQWIAFFDVDEYLFLGDHGCLMDYLQHIDDRAALAVNWRTYSHSNQILQVPPDCLLIETNVHTRGDEEEIGMDHHIKSIVHVDRTVSCAHPHFCVYEDGWSAKDEWGHVVEGPFNQHYPPSRHVHMNHYRSRSVVDFLMKRLRGRADMARVTNGFDDLAVFFHVLARMAFVRRDIQPAVAPVRRILGLD